MLLKGTAFRFITTHLEDNTNTISPIFALVQAQQEIQLVYNATSIGEAWDARSPLDLLDFDKNW